MNRRGELLLQYFSNGRPASFGRCSRLGKIFGYYLLYEGYLPRNSVKTHLRHRQKQELQIFPLFSYLEGRPGFPRPSLPICTPPPLSKSRSWLAGEPSADRPGSLGSDLAQSPDADLKAGPRAGGGLADDPAGHLRPPACAPGPARHGLSAGPRAPRHGEISKHSPVTPALLS